jgi:hypothetical protein
MKVNSIGVDAYRQAAVRPHTDNRSAAGSSNQAERADRIRIPGQGEKVGSELSVRLKPGAFMDVLSAEEKQAIELLFEKFSAARFRAGAYSKEVGDEETELGNHVDVKL